MAAETVPHRNFARILASGAVLWLGQGACAYAFPTMDALTPSAVAPTTGGAAGATDLTPMIGPPGPFGAVVAPGWTFTPRIGLQSGFNDNVLATHSNKRWDWTNFITPGITVTGNTQNVQTRFDYAPTLGIYARTPNQNFLGQNFVGNGQITIVDQLAYMDVRGFAGVQPTNSTGFAGAQGLGGGGYTSAGGGGGYTSAGGSALNLPGNQLVQTTSFGVSPYLMHRFGDIGTAKLGYSLSGTRSSQLKGFGALPFISAPVQNQLNAAGTSNLVTNEEIAQFQTGEFFGRTNNLTTINASQYSGTGVLAGGYQNFLINRTGYAITRTVTVFGEIGYEDIRYSGVPATKIQDMIWTIGTTLTPNSDSTISIGYGHKYGTNNAQINGSYQVTTRFRVGASYSNGLGTDLQQLQNTVGVSDINHAGYLVNAQTGAPMFGSTGQAGGNNNLYRYTQLSATASLTLDRDMINLSISSNEQTLVATAAAGTAAPNNGTAGNISWTHELSPALTSTVSAYYNEQTFSGLVSGKQTTYSGSAMLNYQLSPTLSTSAQYSYFARQSPNSLLSFTQNIFLVGINKSF